MANGIVYIITNPCMESWVKIGMTENEAIQQRLAELNRCTEIPLSFRVYATLHTENPRKVEQSIHKIFDRIDPTLHAREQLENKKERVREFFQVSPEDAFGVFFEIATLMNIEKDLKRIELTEKEEMEEEIAENTKSKLYTEEDHLIGIPNNIIVLYEHFKSAILGLTDDIKIVPRKLYIGFKLKSNICDIQIQQKQLKIFINASKGVLNDPKNIARDISEIGHWGNGDYQILVNNDKDLEYIVSLISQVL